MNVNGQSYRTSYEYREILRILQKASTLQENFLWQAHALGKSVVAIHHFEIDFVEREVVLFLDHHRNRIDPELPVYVKLDYRSSVFKVSTYRQGTNSVHFPFPQELKTLELRANPRHTFHPAQEKAISLRPSLGGNKKDGLELHVRVMDISQFGIGLVVSEQNRAFLKNNRILWITQLQEIELEYPVLAEVVYISSEVDPKFTNRKQKDLKVGLKLSGVFPNNIYKKFIS